MITGVVSLLAVLILAFLRVPLAFALLSVSIIGIGWAIDWSVAVSLLPMTITNAVFSYELAVVPLFILMGNIIARTGISHDLFRAANAFLGPLRGGLALATMVTCAGFSAVCGSSFATAATMSKVAYPSMKRYGYSNELATGTIAAGGTLGILIPPSIILVIYGILTRSNIGELFIAGVLPGLLGLVLYMVAISLITWWKPHHAPRGEPVAWPEKLRTLGGVWPFILLFALIIGGIYVGLFTPTEAAGMGAGLAFIVSALRGRLSLTVARESLIETAYTSIALYMVLFGAMMFSQLMSFSGFAEGLLALVEQTGASGVMVIVAIMLVFLVLGCVLDSMAIILICVPLFTPLVIAHGFDLVWFGILVVVATEIAMITPPIGMNVFVLRATLPSVPVATMFRGLVPFVGADLVRLTLLIAFPSISLWLVSQMG